MPKPSIWEYTTILLEKKYFKDIEMKYIKTENQVADIFTKGLNGLKFEEFRRQLSMITRFKIK